MSKRYTFSDEGLKSFVEVGQNNTLGELVGSLAGELLRARNTLSDAGYGWCPACNKWVKDYDDFGSCPVCS